MKVKYLTINLEFPKSSKITDSFPFLPSQTANNVTETFSFPF